MDYIDGQTLRNRMLSAGLMEPVRALDYTRQVAEGLDSAYKQGVVHRDLKPNTIMINNEDAVKIVGFSLAYSHGAPTLTHSYEFMGTAYYISPEQVESGHTADTPSDLYSLAVIFFEMLTGRPPFEGESIIDIIMKHKKEKVPSVSGLRPGLPVEMDAFFQKAMAKSPVDRY